MCGCGIDTSVTESCGHRLLAHVLAGEILIAQVEHDQNENQKEDQDEHQFAKHEAAKHLLELQHTDRSTDTPKTWTPVGKDLTTLTASKLLKVGIFVRRKK